MSDKKDASKEDKTRPVFAKSNDGTIQITFTIPFTEINKTRETVAQELGNEIEVPGFRKGKAPVSKVIEHLDQHILLEKTLSKILPPLVAKVIEEKKLKLAVYPKFELIKAVEGEDWQIRAVSCEFPTVTLGDYKKEITGAARAKNLWTPDKGEEKDKKVQTREEKEQEIIKILLEKVNVNIPYLLIDEEATSRLSKLLERLEKLGLSLESYLSSIGKTAETLRSEYEKQAKTAISLDLILSEIASSENLTVDTKEIEAAIDAAKADKELAASLNTPERKKFLEVILKRRKALDTLTSLI